MPRRRKYKEHGTYNRYKDGCRCDPCRAAMTVKQREWREAIIAKHGCIPSQQRRNRAGPLVGVGCAVCGVAIKGSHAGSAPDGRVLCKRHRDQSRDWQRKLRVRRARLNKAARGTAGSTCWIAGQCRVCGKQFISSRAKATCCANDCTLINVSANRQRRRARKRTAFVAIVIPRKVFEWDGYRCHLCGKKTDPTKRAPHPKSPTIDHVIPLSKGGTHEPLNCRTAHFRCNASKGNGGSGEQFALLA